MISHPNGTTAIVNGSVKKIGILIPHNGPGLSPEQQANIFQPFIRFDQIKLEGHGLGLSIVQQIVNKLDGQVGVESQNRPGQGSTFMFTLSAIKPDNFDAVKFRHFALTEVEPGLFDKITLSPVMAI